MTTTINTSILNADGSTVPVRAEQASDTSIAFHTVVEVNGSPVSTSNTVPVSDANVGTTADAVYTGSGTASVIASLKGIYSTISSVLAALTGVLTVSNATVGTTADVAYGGTGSSTVVAALKGIYGALTGSIKVQAQAGTALMGGVNLVDTAGSNKAAISASGALLTTGVTGVTITQTNVTLTSSSSQVIAANTNRKFLAIYNVGANAANLNFGGAAVANQGWLLAPVASGVPSAPLVFSGGVVSLDTITGISTSGTTLVVLEGV